MCAYEFSLSVCAVAGLHSVNQTNSQSVGDLSVRMAGLQSVFLRSAVLLWAVFVGFECKVSDELKIVLPHGGGISGKYMTSHRGRGIRAFYAIPYAEPPVGELRFKSPVPKLPWKGVIPTNVDDKMCPQAFDPNSPVFGVEDCLYVNVFAPLEPAAKAPLPVMVFFHGGAFALGNCGAPYYSPEYFLDHDVILVSGNYRLGPLGFLTLGTSDCPGNFGLKDQVLLLQWIQDNIASFNGDPGQVTIFGESAGSASVAYHLISPLSYKLFHKAILQSGTQYAPWAFDYYGKGIGHAMNLGAKLNCPLSDKDSTATFLTCLKNKTADEILKTTSELFDMEEALTFPFLPTVEESAEGFLPKTPTSYKRSHGLNIPIMIGVTSQEGAIMSTSARKSEEAWKKKKSILDRLIYEMSVVPGIGEEEKRQIQRQLKDFYFQNDGFVMENVNNVTDVDGYFVAAMDEFLVNRLVTNENSADTFVYLFAHRGAASFPVSFVDFPEVDSDLGVSHADDLVYLFPMAEALTPHIVPTKVDTFIQTALTEMWVNFATNGHPSTTVSDVTWRAAHGYPLDFLRIGNHGEPQKDIIAMETGLFVERLDVWRKVKSINAQRGEGRDEL